MRPSYAIGGLAALGLALGGAAAAITITPSSYDYGKVAAPKGVAMKEFTITIPGGSASRDALSATLTGPNAAEFEALGTYGGVDRGCEVLWGNGSCIYQVLFRPQSLGPKTATLVVSDRRGNRVTASLKGVGAAPICESKVVFCNYAFLYNGTFNWTSTLSGPGGTSTENVTVTVVKGVAACNGAATDAGSAGQSRTGPIVGTGLIAVEFERDMPNQRTNQPVYRITVACPTPAWPATEDEPATPSRPAELGHMEQQSYNQPASDGVGMDLVGSYTNPSPDTDPLNGVTGQVRVAWLLKQKLLPGDVLK